MRALARDLGEDLGCGAHLEALVRTRSGGFTLDTACTLDEVAARADDEGALRALLLGARVGLQHMPCVELDATQVTRLRHGLRVSCEAAATLAPEVPLLGLGPAGEVIGVVEVDPEGTLRARKILADSL